MTERKSEKAGIYRGVFCNLAKKNLLMEPVLLFAEKHVRARAKFNKSPGLTNAKNI